MSKSLIRKNQLHPDIADLISGYGDNFFVTDVELAQALLGLETGLSLESIVYTTGNQTINGVKSFTSLPNVNGIPLSTGFGGGSEFTFPSNLIVNLTPGKTFGRYQNGDTIEAAGLTTSQVIQLAITEKINPTANLSVSPTQLLLGTTNISNVLSRNYTINNAGASISSASLEWKRGDQSVWTVLDTATTQTSFPHNFTNTVSNSNSINYQYRVVDSQNTTGIATANVVFLYGNYFGYSSVTSLTTVAQIEALGNQILSDSRARTVNGVTAGAGFYTYYAYRADAGDLTSIIQDGAAPVLGAFTKQSDIVGTNLNGASVTYRVYRSNATQAFTNNNLAFS